VGFYPKAPPKPDEPNRAPGPDEVLKP